MLLGVCVRVSDLGWGGPLEDMFNQYSSYALPKM